MGQKRESRGHIVDLLRGQSGQHSPPRSILLPNIQNPNNSICYNQNKNIRHINEFFSLEQYLGDHPQENDSRLSLMKGIQAKFMKKFVNGVSQKNYKKIRSAIMDVMHICIQQNQTAHLLECCLMLGQVQIQFSLFKEAFFSFDQLSCTASFRLDFQLKLHCLVIQSDIVSLQGMHDKAIKYLKKGLQYAWFLHNQKEEIKIYEMLGYENYMLGDLQKAVYYHNRSIENLFESDCSVSKKNNEFLKQADSIRQQIRDNSSRV